MVGGVMAAGLILRPLLGCMALIPAMRRAMKRPGVACGAWVSADAWRVWADQFCQAMARSAAEQQHRPRELATNKCAARPRLPFAGWGSPVWPEDAIPLELMHKEPSGSTAATLTFRVGPATQSRLTGFIPGQYLTLLLAIDRWGWTGRLWRAVSTVQLKGKRGESCWLVGWLVDAADRRGGLGITNSLHRCPRRRQNRA